MKENVSWCFSEHSIHIMKYTIYTYIIKK